MNLSLNASSPVGQQVSFTTGGPSPSTSTAAPSTTSDNSSLRSIGKTALFGGASATTNLLAGGTAAAAGAAAAAAAQAGQLARTGAAGAAIDKAAPLGDALGQLVTASQKKQGEGGNSAAASAGGGCKNCANNAQAANDAWKSSDQKVVAVEAPKVDERLAGNPIPATVPPTDPTPLPDPPEERYVTDASENESTQDLT